MKLADLLRGIVEDTLISNKQCQIKGLALDSRKVEKGFVFIAVAGAIDHGLRYLNQAIEMGAVAVIYDSQGSEHYEFDELEIELIRVKDLTLKMGCIASRFYRMPSENLEIIGITGTNAKTTCSQFLLQLIPECGVIGTLGWGTKERLKETLNTTPDALLIQAILADFLTESITTVVMEVSSHGLQQGRVKAINFTGALFTNLSRDHLDYHGSMDAYLAAKLMLFKQPGLQFVVVNADDKNSGKFLAVIGDKVKPWVFSTTGKTVAGIESVTANQVEYSLNGITFLLCWQEQRIWVKAKVVGDFNLDNILAVITVLLAQGYKLIEVVNKVVDLKPVPGRMESFGGDKKPYIFVDYAHTPDALEKVLKSLKKYCQGKLWLVFGCGGNRDKGKRAQMGAIASKLADIVIITNDNPRFEAPDLIIKDIQEGCKNSVCEVIDDREQAIESAISRAHCSDCIVIAGKGHESYQDIKGVKQIFSDQHIVTKGLLNWK